MSETFSVYQFFERGDYERVRVGVGLQEAVEAARHYTDNVAVSIGITKRVIITDDRTDSCVFEWLAGKGITFPEELARPWP